MWRGRNGRAWWYSYRNVTRRCISVSACNSGNGICPSTNGSSYKNYYSPQLKRPFTIPGINNLVAHYDCPYAIHSAIRYCQYSRDQKLRDIPDTPVSPQTRLFIGRRGFLGIWSSHLWTTIANGRKVHPIGTRRNGHWVREARRRYSKTHGSYKWLSLLTPRSYDARCTESRRFKCCFRYSTSRLLNRRFRDRDYSGKCFFVANNSYNKNYHGSNGRIQSRRSYQWNYRSKNMKNSSFMNYFNRGYFGRRGH